MIAVVDYCKGNLRSMQKGLEAAGGADVRVTADPEQIAAARAIVLPGVGAFADASAFMRESGQMDAIRARIDAGVPFLGVCLGLHLLFEEGVEGVPHEDDDERRVNARGLGVLPGVVRRMPAADATGRACKVPHMGWNTVEIDSGATSPLLEGVPQGEYFYFTHSYIAPESDATQARVTHSTTFPCFVDVGHTCFGIQFHPEKSSDAGLAVLRNFVRVVERG